MNYLGANGGVIPNGWNVVRLGSVAAMIVPMRDKPPEFKGMIPWIRIEDFDGKYIQESKSKQCVDDDTVRAMRLKVYPVGTVLCSCSCSMGATAIVRKPLVSNQTFIGIVPGPKLVSEFLYWALQAYSSTLQSIATGAIQQYLSKQDFKSLRVLVPRPDEQRAISDFLDSETSRIDDLIRFRELEIERLEEMRRRIIDDALLHGWTGPFEGGTDILPLGLKQQRFKHVASIRGRIGFRGYTTADLVAEGEGALTIGATHLNSIDQLDLSQPEYLSWEKYHESPEIKLAVGDVLLVQRGSTIGKSAIVDRDIGPATINPSMILLRPVHVVGRYLWYFLQTTVIRGAVEMVSSTTAIPMITQTQVSRWPVLVPSTVNEQAAICSHLDDRLGRIGTTQSRIRRSIRVAKQYRASLIPPR